LRETRRQSERRPLDQARRGARRSHLVRVGAPPMDGRNAGRSRLPGSGQRHEGRPRRRERRHGRRVSVDMQVMMILLLALAAPAQTRTVTWPDGWFSIEMPAEWSWYEEKEFETGGDLGWVALAPHWEDGFVVIESKTKTDQPLDRLTAFAARSAAKGETMSKPVMQQTE